MDFLRPRFASFRSSRIVAFALASALGLGSFAFSACSAEAPGDDANAGESYQNHTAGEHIQQNSRYLWIDPTFEEAEKVITDFGETTHPTLGEGDDLVRWLQTWSDRIDAVVRADVEKKAGQKFVAPKPVIKVLKTRDVQNAWVTALPACTGASFNLAAGATSTNPIALLDPREIQVGELPCVKPKGWVPKELAVLFNTSKPACELSYDATFHAKEGCTGGDQNATDTALFVTTPHVRFASDLLAGFADERSAIVVLAHELAHYYRSHGSAIFKHKYNFWYDQGVEVARRPVPATNADELMTLYTEVLSGARPVGGDTWTTKVSPRVRSFLADGLGPILVGRTGSFVCSEAADLARAGLPTLRAGEEATLDQRAAYQKYETALLACAAKWRIVDANPGPNEVATLELFNASIHAGTTPAAIAAGKGVADVIAELQTAATKRDARANELLVKLRQNRIGLYTTEQEADDLAMELAVRVGFTPNDVLAGWNGFLDAIEGYYLANGFTRETLAEMHAKVGDVDAATCKAHLAAGFVKDDKKTPITVTLGDLEDNHHASCYRLYNLWREAKAHKYTPGTKKPVSGPTWDELREHAETVSRNAAPPVVDAGSDASDAGPADAGPTDAGRD